MKVNYSHISSLSELKAERNKLRLSINSQEQALIASGKDYIQQFTPVNLFKKYFNRENFQQLDGKVNISGKIMSFILPLVLNKTLFRGSGFVTKAVMGIVSNKLGKKLDVDHLTSIVDKVKGFFTKRNNNPRKTRVVDYGIPPDSETY